MDFQYESKERATGVNHAALFGGNWNNGSNAGSRCSNWNNSASNSNNNIGSRGVCGDTQVLHSNTLTGYWVDYNQVVVSRCCPASANTLRALT